MGINICKCKYCKHIIYSCDGCAYCDVDTDCKYITPNTKACNKFMLKTYDTEKEYWLNKACDVIRRINMDDYLRNHIISEINAL